MTARECKNGCGRMIEWNNELRYFEETATGQRHKCPNYKAKQMSEYESNKAKYGQSNQQPTIDISQIEKKIEAILDRVNNTDVNILGMVGIEQSILNKLMGAENADEILRLEEEIALLKQSLGTLQKVKGFPKASELEQ